MRVSINAQHKKLEQLTHTFSVIKQRVEGLKLNLPLFILLVPNYNWLNYAVNNFFSTHKGGILNITKDCDNNESLSCTGRSECKSRTFIPAAGTRVPPPNKHHPGGSSGTWQRLGMTSPDHNSIEQSARVTNGQREHVSAFHNQSINCQIVSRATTRTELTTVYILLLTSVLTGLWTQQDLQ